MSDFNEKVIKEFRENGGKVGDFFADKTVLLLHTTGAKSGKPRLHPLVTLPHGEDYIVIASSGGAEKHPAWYYNLAANPEVEVEVGTEHFQAIAEVAQEPERGQLYAKMAEQYAFFHDYEEKTKGIRIIPLIVLKRKA